jgi:hypothetical protein
VYVISPYETVILAQHRVFKVWRQHDRRGNDIDISLSAETNIPVIEGHGRMTAVDGTSRHFAAMQDLVVIETYRTSNKSHQ